MGNDAVPYEYEEETPAARGGISGGDVLGAMGQLFQTVREGQITRREREKYQAMRDVAITRILEQSRIAEKLIDRVFEERRRIIEKDFELIDQGMAQNDYTKINMGLQHISDIVKQNPFQIFSVTTAAQRHKMLEDGEFSLE